MWENDFPQIQVFWASFFAMVPLAKLSSSGTCRIISSLARHALLVCSRILFDSGIAFESDARRRHEIPETTRKCTSKAAKMGAIAQCNAPPHAGGEWMPYRFL